MSFSALQRPALLRMLSQTSFDLLVIGGGITGAGIALDAASRGLQVALLEMQDFASGTSSRSTKLIHGGLRYLKQLEFKIVAETGRERAIVYRNAPHVTTPQPMLLPIVERGSLSQATTNLALLVYDLLAGVKKTERRKMLSPAQTLGHEPLLRQEKLLGGAFYYEYRTDDARLTIEILKKAVQLGATALNYCQVIGFIKENDRLTGVQARDLLSGESLQVKATQVVNAAGPWVDQVDKLDEPSSPNKLIHSKGVHLVVDHSCLPLRQSVYFDVEDGRMIFAIPREGKTYIGTTDTFYQGELLHPDIQPQDIQYLLKATQDMFPSANLNATDVESGWSGLRPLIRQSGKGASEISRRDEIFTYPSGLITIAGGKLTGYRKMAERVVNRVVLRLYQLQRKRFKPCNTHRLYLSGASENWKEMQAELLQLALKKGIPQAEATRLTQRYGSNLPLLLEKLPLSPGTLPNWLEAELNYSIKEEMCTGPADFFVRRTGALYFDIHWVQHWKQVLIQGMAQILNWSAPQKAFHEVQFDKALSQLLPTPLSAS
jgi:glycerol-3-phosphate dehydrogenase